MAVKLVLILLVLSVGANLIQYLRVARKLAQELNHTKQELEDAKAKNCRSAKIIADKNRQLDITDLAKRLGTARNETELHKALLEISSFFPGRIKVITTQDERIVETHTRIPLGWNLDSLDDKNPMPLHERYYSVTEDGIRVNLYSNQSFNDEGNMVGSLLAKAFTRAILDNAVLTKDVREVQDLAKHDSLSRLLNRLGYEERLNVEIERALRYEEELVLAVFDADDFKQVNDYYGHDVGDEAIRKIADILKRDERWSDVSCRWGGDEFTIIMPHTDFEGAIAAFERIREDVANIRLSQAPKVRLGISVGVASLKDAEENRIINGGKREERGMIFFTLADRAMLSAKKKGKNRTVVWTTEIGR